MSVADAGQRTVLAWRRSGLSFMACGFAMVRGVHGLVPSRPLAGTLVLALGLGVWGLFTWTAYRRGTDGSLTAPPPARLADIAPLAFGTVVLGVVCIAIELAA
jgi:uncharacterized membrane protein YidH (DUF202 family)